MEMVTMQETDWQFSMDLTQSVGAVLSVVFTAAISYILWTYTNKKDRLDFLISRWNQQQEANLQTLSSESDLIAFEKLVYGTDHEVDIDEARLYTHLFIVLNFLQNNWFAKELGIITADEFRKYSLPTLSLISNNKETIIYLLKERGYQKEFLEEIERLLPQTSAPKPVAGPSPN
jgi:hypothetical protein